MVLASLLFMRRMIEISGTTLVGDHHTQSQPKKDVLHYEIAGPLFFGAAYKALEALTTVDHTVRHVVIDLADVPAVDATGLVALQSALEHLHRLGITVAIEGVRPQPERALAKAEIVSVEGLTITPIG